MTWVGNKSHAIEATSQNASLYIPPLIIFVLQLSHSRDLFRFGSAVVNESFLLRFLRAARDGLCLPEEPVGSSR